MQTEGEEGRCGPLVVWNATRTRFSPAAVAARECPSTPPRVSQTFGARRLFYGGTTAVAVSTKRVLRGCGGGDGGSRGDGAHPFPSAPPVRAGSDVADRERCVQHRGRWAARSRRRPLAPQPWKSCHAGSGSEEALLGTRPNPACRIAGTSPAAAAAGCCANATTWRRRPRRRPGRENVLSGSSGVYVYLRQERLGIFQRAVRGPTDGASSSAAREVAISGVHDAGGHLYSVRCQRLPSPHFHPPPSPSVLQIGTAALTALGESCVWRCRRRRQHHPGRQEWGGEVGAAAVRAAHRRPPQGLMRALWRPPLIVATTLAPASALPAALAVGARQPQRRVDGILLRSAGCAN